MKFNRIIQGDCLTVMKKLPSACVDGIITSPPYNLRNATGGGFKRNKTKGMWDQSTIKNGYEDYTDDIPYDKYVKWQRRCLQEMMRLIPDTGAIFYNHKWRVQNNLIQDRHEIVTGFPVRQIIIWSRGGGINFNLSFFLPTYEVIYLIAKSEFKLLPKMCKFGDVWNFPPERSNPHPAPFPVNLPDRIIKACGAKKVLDPFMGSGTTAIAALMNNAQYLGIEQSSKYIKLAKERITSYKASFGEKSLFG